MKFGELIFAGGLSMAAASGTYTLTEALADNAITKNRSVQPYVPESLSNLGSVISENEVLFPLITLSITIAAATGSVALKYTRQD